MCGSLEPVELSARQFMATCGHKAKDITPSIAWRRKEALDDLPWKDKRGPKPF